MMSKKPPVQCALCDALKCWNPGRKGKFPAVCAMEKHKDLIEETTQKGWTDPEARRLNVASENLFINGYDKQRGDQWSRVEELIYFMKDMGYQKIGIAFCVGLFKEAKILHLILEKNGFEVVSVNCMAGGIPRSELEKTYSVKTRQHGGKVVCNPLMQAEVLNREKTDFNVIFGLCLGHDTLFIKYSTADVTTLVVKDRVLAHNPIGALYLADIYYRRQLFKEFSPNESKTETL